ncbi:MAG: BamA/TamA family outer membrane protein [Salibacteraceae bacterium]|nr:BamA/TamA family outer membrane protein [Salibacteraceae bacterium]
MVRLFLIFVFTLATVTLHGQQQKKISYQIYWSDSEPTKKLKKNSNGKNLTAKEFKIQKDRLFGKLSAQGYISSEIVKFDSTSTPWIIEVAIGKQFEWKKLDAGNAEEGMLSKIGFRDKIYQNRPISSSNVNELFSRVIDYYENNGYPFASIQFDSVNVKKQQIEAQLKIDKSIEITIDTVIITGTAKISNRYLSNYLGIKSGDLYNEKLIRDIPLRIKELAFTDEYRAAEVEFGIEANSTKLYVYINHKKANDFDGIIGFMPDDVTGKLLVTGDIKLKLQNAIGKGEVLDVSWKKMQTQTQDLKARIQYPFLFDTPLGVDATLHIYRRDTTFSTVTTDVGIQYIFRGGDYVKVFWEKEQSNLISTLDLDIASALPEYADVIINSFGFGSKIEELDYRLNPTKGFDIEGQVGFGNKEIRQNPSINPVLYDSLKLKTTRIKGQVTARYFIPLFARHTIMFGNNSGVLINENLFTNELFRIGGLKTLRGFDEESIFASSYSVFTFEYRFILEENSYFSIFYDQGWYENQSSTAFITDTPFGFGTGISFDTKIGIFSVSYALGKQMSNPILIRAAKIHFGFVNFF